jgi:DNA mismatch repair ATPase MutS
LDELGRGTSTFDGTAIAHAVVDFMVSRIGCRTLFATHYHTLINDWSIDPRIRLGHMDCLVNSDGSDTNGSEEVTFLYRLCDGSSPRSYGLNVARLAKLPEEVIALAYQQSHAFELKMTTTSSKDSVTGSAENQLRVIVYQFFERLVSILRSNNDGNGNPEEGVQPPQGEEVGEELYWITSELWRRYVHMLSRSKK